MTLIRGPTNLLFTLISDGQRSSNVLALIWNIVMGFSIQQLLWVILCRLPEQGRNEIEEILEEVKERDREGTRTGIKHKKQKQLKIC